jgi:hypothetical protein
LHCSAATGAGSKALEVFNPPFATLVLTNVAISLIAVPFIFLLPDRIVDRQDSELEAATHPPSLAHALAE